MSKYSNNSTSGGSPVSALIRSRYEPLTPVGEGGQGQVLVALDHQHNRKVAIKVRSLPSSDDGEALLQEARVLLSLTPNPGLPIVRDDFFENGVYYLVMDWIDGRDLSVWLREEGAPGLPYAHVCGWLEQIAASLDHLHDHNPPVVHRDVKPSNIVVTQEGRAVLVDLGLGELQGFGARYAGTRSYLAPEIAAGEGSSPKSDIFALAVTAWELLTGSMPFPGAHPDWSSVPSEHVARIARSLSSALAVDPSARPGSAGALIRSILPPPTRTNLAAPLSSFVGRESALLALTELMATSRLVNLVGLGGSGKTRLAEELARQMFGSFPGGVWFCGLSSLVNSDSLHQVVASSLGVAKQAAKTLLQSIISFVADDKCLIVFDNCEHVIDECARITQELLSNCQNLRVLATSRERLGIPGETVWAVPPLDLPDLSAEQSLESAERSGAVQLFRDRGRAVNQKFRLDERTLDSVVDICIGLEGVPLSIELAAALLGTLPLEEIVTGLSNRLDILTTGYRTASPRQRTLRNTLQWSYDLLSDDEQLMFRRLSVFAGGFMLEAAGKVAPDVEAAAVIEGLDRASLLQRRSTNEGIRFMMLETVRDFAAERLQDSEEEASRAREAHLSHFLDLAQSAYEELKGPRQAHWLSLVDDEIANFRSALALAVNDNAHTDDALAITSRLARYWSVRGYVEEAHTWLSRALTHPSHDSQLRGRALSNLGNFKKELGDPEGARSAYEDGLKVSRQAGDKTGEAAALVGLGILASGMGQFDEAEKLLEEALGLLRQTTDLRSTASCQYNLGVAKARRGDHHGAREQYEDALRILREVGDAREISGVLTSLANGNMKLGDYEAAQAYYKESLELAERLGDRSGIAVTTFNMGNAARFQGDFERADENFKKTLEIAREVGNKSLISSALMGLGSLASSRGDHSAARPLFEESSKIAEELGNQRGIGQALHNLAFAQGGEGDLLGAKTSLERALDVTGQIGDREGTAEILNSLGVNAWERNDPPAALASFEEALAIAKEIGYVRLEVGVLIHMAEAHREQGDSDVARDLIIRALAASYELGDRTRIGQSLLQLVWVTREQDSGLATRVLGAIEANDQELITMEDDKRSLERVTESLRDELDSEAFDELYEAGRLDPHQTISEATQSSPSF